MYIRRRDVGARETPGGIRGHGGRAARARDTGGGRGSLYSGPGPKPGPTPSTRSRRRAAARERGAVQGGQADPRLRRQRLPQGRVPLPGLPLRRPRRAGHGPRPQRPAAGRSAAPFSRSERHLHAIRTTTGVRATTPPTWSSCGSSRCADATAFRITLNSLTDPDLVATTIAIGDSAAPRPFPHGANVERAGRAVPDRARDRGRPASTRRPARRSTPAPTVEGRRRSGTRSTVRVPHAAWDPGTEQGPPRRRRRALGRGRRPLPDSRADADRDDTRAAPAGSPPRPRSSTSPSASTSRCPTSATRPRPSPIPPGGATRPRREALDDRRL